MEPGEKIRTSIEISTVLLSEGHDPNVLVPGLREGHGMGFVVARAKSIYVV